MRSKQIKSTNPYSAAVNNKLVEAKEFNELQQDFADASSKPFQVMLFANPLVLDASVQKDFVCYNISGNTTINMYGTEDGDAGLIELLITGAGGYTIALGAMFTKDIAGTTLDTTAAADNFIGWRKVGSDIVYNISQVQ